MIIQHWLLLCSGVTCPRHSLTKAAKAVKELALTIALAMAQQSQANLVKTLQTIVPIIKMGTFIDKRKKSQSTYQRLFAVSCSFPLFPYPDPYWVSGIETRPTEVLIAHLLDSSRSFVDGV